MYDDLDLTTWDGHLPWDNCGNWYDEDDDALDGDWYGDEDDGELTAAELMVRRPRPGHQVIRSLRRYVQAVEDPQQLLEAVCEVSLDLHFKDVLSSSFPDTIDQYYMSIGRKGPTVEGLAEALRAGAEAIKLRHVAEAIGVATTPPATTADDLIRGLIPAGQIGTLSGPKNGLKTKYMVDLAVSVASGTPFLNRWPIARSVPVAFFAGEDSSAEASGLCDRIATAKGVEPASLQDRLHLSTHVPAIADEKWLEQVQAFIASYNIELLCVDGAYLGLGTVDQRSIFSVGNVLGPLKQLTDKTGCSIIVSLHHKASARRGWPVLNDIAGVGFEQAARYWILTNRSHSYDPQKKIHRMRLVVGNKRGEQRFLLRVREGRADDRDGLRWEVSIMDDKGRPISDAQQSSLDAAEVAISRHAVDTTADFRRELRMRKLK